MQACIVEAYGPADVVKVAEVATPAPQAGEVLVRVRAAAVTSADWRFRAAVYPLGFRLIGRLMFGLLSPRRPILGMDFAGVVAAVGPGVTRFRVGERVFGSTAALRCGAHAEYLVAREDDAMRGTPDGLSDEEAAALPFGGNSALAFLRDFASLRPGQRVLVVGASGAVGAMAVQIARDLGAQVTGVCSAANAELVRELGAERVIDYRSQAPVAPGDRYDVIFDTIGVTTFAECRAALEGGGPSGAGGLWVPLNGGLPVFAQALLSRLRGGPRVVTGVSQNTRASLDDLCERIARGALRPVVGASYPPSAIVEAHRAVESRHKRGSVIVRF